MTLQHVVVVGIGAMGGGMARALLDSNVSETVAAFDVSPSLTRAFWEEARRKNKCASYPRGPPISLSECLRPATGDTTVKLAVLVVLQTEEQCEDVCFGSSSSSSSSDGESGGCLLDLVPRGSCVVVTSTVTATWMRKAAERFEKVRGVHFVDGPVSGGPARARAGDLTVMASGTPESLDFCRPVLDSLARQVFTIEGGVGMASTVKMVHQLLAGVHICVAAEALALAVAAGVNVEQLYEIVTSAAGHSWMFGDRGPRMMTSDPEVKSMLDIFVKDLDIVYQESKRLRAPIPVASIALQQFIAGQRLGLGKLDDSQVVRVYERITGVSVASTRRTNTEGDGNQVGDLWRLNDGSVEEILEVAKEPRHKVIIDNEYVRAIRVEFPAGDTTLAHRHEQDSIYFYMVTLDVINYVKGCDPKDDSLEFGEIRYGTHKTDQPLIHKMTNKSESKPMLCIDAEVVKRPPAVCASPMVADKHELIKTRSKCRVYRLTLEPGESATVSYPFFHLSVILQSGRIQVSTGGLTWVQDLAQADVAWKEPLVNLTKTNVGETMIVEYIAEWC